MTKNTHFVSRLIENGTISETFKDRVMEGIIGCLRIDKGSQCVLGCTHIPLVILFTNFS